MLAHVTKWLSRRFPTIDDLSSVNWSSCGTRASITWASYTIVSRFARRTLDTVGAVDGGVKWRDFGGSPRFCLNRFLSHGTAPVVGLLLWDSCREAIAVRAVRRLGFRRAAASDGPRQGVAQLVDMRRVGIRLNLVCVAGGRRRSIFARQSSFRSTDFQRSGLHPPRHASHRQAIQGSSQQRS